MKAVIPAAGLGTGLLPATKEQPKEMLPHLNYSTIFKEKEKGDFADELRNFYLATENSSTVWVSQSELKGFWDAVVKVAPFVGNEPILVHADDTYVISDQNRHLKNLMKVHGEISSDVAFVIQRVEAKKIEGDVYKVTEIVERPDKPPTNLLDLRKFLTCWWYGGRYQNSIYL